MSKLYINPLTGKRARLLGNGDQVVLYGRFGNRTIHHKPSNGEHPSVYWNRYLKKRGYKTALEVNLKEACEK